MFHLVSTSQEDPRTMQRTLQTNTHAPQQWLLVLWLVGVSVMTMDPINRTKAGTPASPRNTLHPFGCIFEVP
ncbi:hypothetical protein NC653_021383 [Populus alba x Populus x berolinensis]|uniref:Uncharacterized protein n=1 Tax=Populus alba x Populus x berolinensis TaxID=444605 RepID=A0AAD6MMT7_9ROSI|nr:hypothetical protein NC653_021383 [Populus alba x Populus x berolinensis]